MPSIIHREKFSFTLKMQKVTQVETANQISEYCLGFQSLLTGTL